MEKKMRYALTIAGGIVAAISGAFCLWSHAFVGIETILVGSEALQYGYAASAPMLAESLAFIAALWLAAVLKFRPGHIARTVLLTLGLFATILTLAGPLLAAFMPVGLQLALIALIVLAARFPAIMIVPGLLIGFGLGGNADADK